MRAFTGKVAVVTGAGSGMGAALAKGLGARGATLALCDRDEAGLEALTEFLEATGVRASRHTVDVADPDALSAFAAAVEKEHGAAHLLFNNAGVSLTDRVSHMSLADFQWLMDINFWGVVNGCRAFLPLLSKASSAHIINTASIFGVVAVPTQSAYNASKFAVRGFTESLEQELRDTSIRVSCVLPGGVRTNIVKSSRYYAADNTAPTRDELIARFEQLAALSSEQAAEIILTGVRRDKRRIIVGRDARLLDWVARLLPSRYPDVLHWLQQRAPENQRLP